MSKRRIGSSTSVTVSDLAAHYGSTSRFVVLALQGLGVDVHTAGDWLAPGVQVVFEDAYGDRIRAARPVPVQPPSAADPQSSLGSQETPPADHSANERTGAGTCSAQGASAGPSSPVLN